MPTLSKLVAALMFGGLAYLVSGMIELALPSDVMRAPAYFSPVNAALGALIGWRFCGAKAGGGYVTALGVGLTTSITLGVLGLLIWAFAMMMRRALRLAYDGPVEALLAGISIAVEFGAIVLAHPAALVVLAVGGLIGGVAAEPFAERHPGA